jgi:hypothetical protein
MTITHIVSYPLRPINEGVCQKIMKIWHTTYFDMGFQTKSTTHKNST